MYTYSLIDSIYFYVRDADLHIVYLLLLPATDVKEDTLDYLRRSLSDKIRLVFCLSHEIVRSRRCRFNCIWRYAYIQGEYALTT